MSSPPPFPSPNNSTTMETPAAKNKEDYADYDLSPPKLQEKERRSFDKAVRAINNDFKNELRVEWERESEEKRTVVWFKKRGDGTEVELPSDFRRILLFLYSRNFKKHVGVDKRKVAVKAMLKNGHIRKIILQVIKCTGDHSLSFDENYRAHYIRACLTIHRYFQQTGATGFVPDMSSVTYYLRMQKFRSCFIQAACVAMSYLLHAHGISVPPPNASRLIRHHFDDEQLIKYVEDYGGDSVGIFKILEENFFVCQPCDRDPLPVLCSCLGFYDSAPSLLKQGSGLVSKFMVPNNFVCSPPSSDLKQKFPQLAPYESWNAIPANLIPPGVARFTKWNEPAEFIPSNAPSDAGLKEEECVLRGKWEALLRRSSEDDGQSTAVTASMSADSSSCVADNGSLGAPGEQSTANNAPTFKFTGVDSDDDSDDDSDGEDWSHLFDDDHEDDSNSSASYEDHEPGEGAAETLLHAMVLLGHRMVDGSEYWVMQNSWEGPTQILEVSTEYLRLSGAYLYFYPKDSRSPKPKDRWNIRSSSFFCSSPVAESSRLERNDCENWTDDLIHSVPRESDTHDIFNDL